jgi:hypothetical protein
MGDKRIMSKKHDDAECPAPNPDALALKLFVFTTLGCIAYATAVLIFIEVFAP